MTQWKAITHTAALLQLNFFKELLVTPTLPGPTKVSFELNNVKLNQKGQGDHRPGAELPETEPESSTTRTRFLQIYKKQQHNTYYLIIQSPLQTDATRSSWGHLIPSAWRETEIGGSCVEAIVVSIHLWRNGNWTLEIRRSEPLFIQGLCFLSLCINFFLP